MADDEHNTTTTWSNMRRQMTSPWNVDFSLARRYVVGMFPRTIFLGHVCVHGPRGALGDIK